MNGLWKFYDTAGRLTKTTRYPLPTRGIFAEPDEELFEFALQDAKLADHPFDEINILLQELITELSHGELEVFKDKHPQLYFTIDEKGITSLLGKNRDGFYTLKRDTRIKAWPARVNGRPTSVFYKINYQVFNDY
jgi:hypothetical protein